MRAAVTQRALRVPAGTPVELAALTEPLAVGSDDSPARRALATDLGCDEVVDPAVQHPMVEIGKELTLQFALGYFSVELSQALDWIADGAADLEPLITDPVTIDQIPAAFAALGDPKRQAKILVMPDN
jgi:threonine dehydrogenase-like Zn-dependent dehydrogenase